MISRLVGRVIAALATVVIVALALFASGPYLVVDRPQRADAVVVLAGDRNDRRYWKGIELLREGYAPTMLFDANTDMRFYGRTPAQSAAEFVAQSAGNVASRVRVCPIEGDSTVGETRYVSACLAPLHAHRVLLVTSDYHTRRAFSIFRRRVPQYQWFPVAVKDDAWFGPQWWQRREWAKTNLGEWERLVWWELVERWKA